MWHQREPVVRVHRSASRLVSDDTIVAISTAPGEGAIGVIRVSGPAAIGAVSALLARGRPELFPSHTLKRVTLVDPRSGDGLDEALCVVMRAPRSYTGEDVVELSCHGSPALLHLVTDLIRQHGARLAEPGEFTRRAFLNGRLDLIQAEAVALMISARTARAVALAARALYGGLSEPLRKVYESLLDLIAGLEVTLDFPEERVGTDVHDAASRVARLRDEVARQLSSARHGRLVHEGLTIVLVGIPNAGKSSLLNALLGRERAIVSPVAGTTRDIVDGTIVVDGVPVHLLDTAGIGHPKDSIEAEGMRRSRQAIEESDVTLVVFDGSFPPDEDLLQETAKKSRILVRAKSDLDPHPASLMVQNAVSVSARTGAGLDELVARMARVVQERTGNEGDERGIIASLRQIELLEGLHHSLACAASAFGALPLEAALVDMRQALQQSALLLGIDVGEAILDRIFSTFCLGK